MTRQSTSRVALLMIGLTVLTGCHPTQPFYFNEDGDLSHLIERATEIEHPDVCTESLPDATACEAPLTVTNPEFKEIWDLKLEECVSIGLHNSKVVRNLGAVTPIGFADGLLGRTGGSETVYDAAITSSEPGSQATGAVRWTGFGFAHNRVRANAQGGVEAALSDFDAWLRIGGDMGSNSVGQNSIFSRVDHPSNSGSAFFPTLQDQDAGGLRTVLEKQTASGAHVALQNVTRYDRTNNGLLGIRALSGDWVTEFEARVDYPLLRGRGTQINRLHVVLARINEDISLASFEAAVRNSVKDLEDTYWDLHGAYRRLETAKTGRDSALGAWKIAYEKWTQGVEAIQNEAQARENYFNFRAQVERSLQELYSVETRLRWLMGLAATDGRLIRPIDEPTIARVDFDWCAIRTEALVRSAELRQAKWSIKQRELELISAKNQLLPELDVGAFYKWVGRGDELINANRNGIAYPGVGSTAFEELTGGNYQEAGFFLGFGMPVGFRRELAGVRNAQLRLAREKAVLEDQELQTIHLLSTAVRDVDSFYVQAETHFNRWSAAEKEVESQTALYKGGKQTVDFVLEAQRRRAQAQVDYYTSLIEYNKAIADVHFRKGSLLEYNNIELAEGPWPEKAYWDALQLARERDASYYFDYGWTRPNVVSQGPVPQGPGGMPVEEFTPAETIPTPAPTPAEQKSPPSNGGDANSPLTLPLPEPDPVTNRSDMPLLTAPALRTADAGGAGQSLGNPLRSPSSAEGSHGLDPLRSPSIEADSQVRPAAYVTTISDSE